MTHLTMLSTVIPDEVIIGLLGVILTAGGATLKMLWEKVNRLQSQLSKLSLQLEIYRNCPASECPAHYMVERARMDHFPEASP